MQPFTFSSILKIFVLCCFLLFAKEPMRAQIKLPEVPKASDGKSEIKSTYIPHGNFLKKNPDFLKDGAYFFNIDFVAKGSDKSAEENNEWYAGHHEFNSEDFPIAEEVSLKNLSGFGKILVQLTTDLSTQSSIFGGAHFNNTASKTDISDPKTYEIVNNSYHQSVNSILTKKSVDSFSISEIASLEFDKMSFSNSNLILQFIFVQGCAWYSNKSADNFPSNTLYKLLVKDMSGNQIKSYGQAIFFEEKGTWSESNDYKGLMLRTTFPVAMENLINRFLNDEKTVQIVKAKISDEIAAKNINTYHDSLYTFKQQYNYIQSKKQQLLFDLSVIKNRNAWIKIHNDILSKKYLESILESNQRKIISYRHTATQINNEEEVFFNGLDGIFEPFDIALLGGQKEKEDADLNNSFAELSQEKDEMNKLFTAIKQERAFKIENLFTAVSTISSLLTNPSTVPSAATTTISPQAETMATTKGGNMDVCMQRANSEWYSSEEYKRYKKTGLNSDASDCKAKIMELTIKYCSDKLPPNELTQIKQQAIKERQLADQIRAANKFNLKQ